MSCADVQTIQAGNGTKTQFSFDFPYLLKSEIKVYFWNDTTKEWDEILTDGLLSDDSYWMGGTDAYPWQVTDANPTIVEFTSTAPPAPTAPDNVDNVRIRRVTNIDDIKALFSPGSAIRSDDLNRNFEQLRYAIQENGCQEVPEEIYEFLDNYYWNNYADTVYSTDTWTASDTKIATTAAIDAQFLDAATETITSSESWVENDDTVPTTLAASNQYDTLVQVGTPTGTNYPVGKTWLQNDANLTLSVWNGTNWLGIASGGTFTNQPKVVYVDATAGDDNNDGHRISRPKKTIKAAVEQINADSTYGDGSIVSVAPGIYAETLPIDITKNDVGIIGQSLRTCIIHPKIPTADHATYDVNTPHAQELETMFRVNSGSYFQNLTLTGMKASGTRGGVGSLYEDATYGLPVNQGWNFAFYPNAIIKKSPYVQNVTNFSDSQINNVTFTPHTPGEGAAGDLDSAPTGGGILVDGSVPSTSYPLRSMVCDSYTHTALDGPGIFVTNNGYCQGTSSYAFFNHAHITAVNGGQANLAASTTDFGRYGLVADGKSATAIFTSNVDGAANSGATSFNINEPAAGTGWFGDTQRPANNMLVEVNGIVYPILSATARTDTEGGSGWTVEISRPDPTNRNNNLGLNGAISDDDSVSFFLRSMIASSGHTMEYVGSGTNYTALPENGGVPTEANQKVELNDGKIWAATTDHNGKFTLGGNQSEDPTFTVDQQLGFVTIPVGSIAFDLASDATPQLAADLDAQSNKITSLADPTSAQDAATKNYVDTEVAGLVDAAPATLDTLNELAAALGDDANFSTTVTNSLAAKVPQTSTTGAAEIPSGTTAQRDGSPSAGYLRFNTTDVTFEGWNGTEWGPIGGGSGFEMATTPPANPSDGDTYWDTEEGLPYIYYEDGSSNQWVPLVPSTPPKNATGGGTDEVFFENDNAVTTNYTLQTGKNALSAGPITINSGVTVTVPSGQSWVIV